MRGWAGGKEEGYEGGGICFFFFSLFYSTCAENKLNDPSQISLPE